MSDANLSSCRAKLAYAKKKLDALKREISTFKETRPYYLDTRPGPPEFEWFLRIERPPPEDFGIEAGGIATNARSSLDYLVTQLAIANGVDRASALNKRSARQFPIFLDEGDYRQARGRGKSYRELMLDRVSPRHKRYIDRFQPYQRGLQSAPDDPLALLRAISDREKHRDPEAIIAVMRTLTLKFPVPEGAFLRAVFSTSKPLQDGDVLFSIATEKVVPGVQIGVEALGAEPDFDLAFLGERVVTLDDLERIVLHISHIIDFFEVRI